LKVIVLHNLYQEQHIGVAHQEDMVCGQVITKMQLAVQVLDFQHQRIQALLGITLMVEEFQYMG
jgi:hypothetical protein